MSVLNPDALTGMRNGGIEDAPGPSEADLRDAATLTRMATALSAIRILFAHMPTIECRARWCRGVDEDASTAIEEQIDTLLTCAKRLEAGEAREEYDQ